MNLGAKLLKAKKLSLSKIVHATKVAGHAVSRTSVSEWQSGKKLPVGAARSVLLKAFGIPTSAWDKEADAAQGLQATDIERAHILAGAERLEDPANELTIWQRLWTLSQLVQAVKRLAKAERRS